MAAGNAVIATAKFVLPYSIDVVWQIIGVENQAQEQEFEGATHRVTADHGGGNHDCIVEGVAAGNPVTVPGTRRLVDPYTIIERQSFSSVDRVFTTVMRKGRRGRTKLEISVAVQVADGKTLNPEKVPNARRDCEQIMERFQQNALRALQSS
jgi:hypothetical protein